MDGLIVLLILIFLILLISINKKTSAQKRVIDSLNKKMNQLTEQFIELTKFLKEREHKTPDKIFTKESIEKTITPLHEPYKETPVPETKSIPEKKITIEIKPEPLPEEKKIAATEIIKEPPVVIETKPIKVNETGWWDKWLQNNPDLEKFIGENLANKIGIAILVLGIGFFVKYAIDKEWINEAGRVIIGLACGGLLIGIAHFFRNTYRSFSSVLAGGGLAVFYFTIGLLSTSIIL